MTKEQYKTPILMTTMTQYQADLMALIKQANPDLDTEQLKANALELYNKIKTALDENRERLNKK